MRPEPRSVQTRRPLRPRKNPYGPGLQKWYCLRIFVDANSTLSRQVKVMCLAVPVRVTEILDENWALVDLGGVTSRVSLAFVDDVAVGDYLIVHVGHAIARLDVAQAEESLALFRQIADTLGIESDALHTRVP